MGLERRRMQEPLLRRAGEGQAESPRGNGINLWQRFLGGGNERIATSSSTHSEADGSSCDPKREPESSRPGSDDSVVVKLVSSGRKSSSGSSSSSISGRSFKSSLEDDGHAEGVEGKAIVYEGLLPKAEASQHIRNASTASAVFNLTTTSVGAGIMALPAAMKVLGVPLGMLAILSLGWLTDFALEVLVRTSFATGARSYGQLMGTVYGPWGRFVTQLFVMLQALGSLIVYLIITGDVLSGSTSWSADGTPAVHHMGVLEEWAGGPTWWNGRLPVLLFVLVFVLLPLASLSRIDSLMLSSAISVALAVLFVLFTVVACAVRFIKGQLDPPRMFPDLTSWPEIMATLTTVPVMANAFICHYNVQPIQAELEDSSEKAMCRVAKLSQVLVTLIYSCCSLSSYLLFGDATASDVLANFDVDIGFPKVATDVVRLGYVVHLLLVFPIIHFPLRLTLDILLFPQAILPLPRDATRFWLLTVGLLSTIFFCAIVIPDIYILFSFLGALVSVSIGFTFPALLAIKSQSCSWSKSEQIVAWGMLLLGLYLTISGLIADASLFSK